MSVFLLLMILWSSALLSLTFVNHQSAFVDDIHLSTSGAFETEKKDLLWSLVGPVEIMVTL